MTSTGTITQPNTRVWDGEHAAMRFGQTTRSNILAATFHADDIYYMNFDCLLLNIVA